MKYDSVLSRNVKIRYFLLRNVKIRYFLSRNIKIRAMSRKNAINCVPSRLRILISPGHGDNCGCWWCWWLAMVLILIECKPVLDRYKDHVSFKQLSRSYNFSWVRILRYRFVHKSTSDKWFPCWMFEHKTCSDVTSQHEGAPMDVNLVQIAWTERMTRFAVMKVKSESLPP